MRTFSYGLTPPEAIREAVGDRPYPMTLSLDDEVVFVAAYNQGIDSYLEAMGHTTWERETGNIVGNRLKVVVGPQDMPVLLRRLLEIDEDERTPEDIRETAMPLRSAILETLGIEEV